MRRQVPWLQLKGRQHHLREASSAIERLDLDLQLLAKMVCALNLVLVLE